MSATSPSSSASFSSRLHWRIRDAVVEDVPLILSFIRKMANYSGETHESVKSTEQTLARDGFGPSPIWFCRIAEQLFPGASLLGFGFAFTQ